MKNMNLEATDILLLNVVVSVILISITVVVITLIINIRLKPLSYELKSNGGTSLKDVVKRIEARQKIIYNDQKDLQDNHNSFYKLVADTLTTATLNTRRLQALEDETKYNIHIGSHVDDLAMYRIDENIKIQWVNQDFLDLFEITMEEAMHEDWMQYIDKPDQERLRTKNATHDIHSEWNATYTIIGARTGAKKRVNTQAEPIFELDHFVGWFGVIEHCK